MKKKFYFLLFIFRSCSDESSRQRGNLLLIMMMMILVGSVMVAAVAKMTSSNSIAGLDSLYATEALFLAESGIEAARYSLFQGGCNTASASIAGTLARGEYTADISAGPPWTITSTGYAPSQTSPRGKRILTQVVPDINPFISTSITLTGIPQIDSGAGYVNVNGSGNAIRADAARENISQFSPAIPAYQASTGADGSVTANSNQVIPAGNNYTTITINNTRTYTFNAGIHKITTLNIYGGIASMGAGTYYIGTLNITNYNGGKINPQGAVVINVNTFTMNRSFNFNNEAGYNIDDLIIYLNTSLAWNTSSDNVRTNAILIGGAGMTGFRFRGDNNTFQGGIYSQRMVQIDTGNTFKMIYDDAAKTAVKNALGSYWCNMYTVWDEIF